MNHDKLKKCLALMASETDGEALAATRMVVRMLKTGGHRPEDLSVGTGEQTGSDALFEVRVSAEVNLRMASAMQMQSRNVEAEVRCRMAKREAEVEALKAELRARIEETKPPLPWEEIAERHNRPGQKSKRVGDGVEFRARTNRLTIEDRVLLRALHEKDERRKKRKGRRPAA